MTDEYDRIAESLERVDGDYRVSSESALAAALRRVAADARREGEIAGAEAAAALCAQVRCRTWEAPECARQIRERVRDNREGLPTTDDAGGER